MGQMTCIAAGTLRQMARRGFDMSGSPEGAKVASVWERDGKRVTVFERGARYWDGKAWINNESHYGAARMLAEG